MFATQIAAAISCAQFSEVNDLAHKLWKAHAAGHLDDDTAQALAEQLEMRKGGYLRQGPAPKNAPTAFLLARRQRSPDRNRSIERRRRLARASPVPPELVDKFTQGEHAVITVVAGEIQRVGQCTWPLARIAAIAGVCVTLVRGAIRKGRNVGLLFSIERRRRGQKSLTNIVRVLRRSWGAWLKRIGYRKKRSRTDVDSRTRKTDAVESFKEGIGASPPAPRSGLPG